MRIVHLSDLHFGLWPERFFQAMFDKRILGLINFFLRRRAHAHHDLLERAISIISDLQPDIVVCSGDITSISSEREFQAAVKALRPLVDNPDFDFIYVPGNHDHYVRDRHCQKAFRNAFQELNRNRWKLEDLPAILTVENNQLMICDECRPTNIFLSSGQVDAHMAAAFAQWLERPAPQGCRRLLVGHYPTRDQNGLELSWRRRLNGGQIIRQALQDGRLDASLCGHIHHPFVQREKNGGIEVCAGSLTMNGNLNVMDIPGDPQTPIQQRWHELQ